MPSGRAFEVARLPTADALAADAAGRFVSIAARAVRETGRFAVALSGGSEPGDEINRTAVTAMEEVGIDITGEHPKRWTDEMLGAADVVVTMGCGDTCPFVPGKRYEDWDLDDPAGQPLAAVRPIRDEIAQRVRTLLVSLGVELRA